MSINFTQLASEINTDPTALGYAPFKAAGNDAAIADLLNTRRTTISVEKNEITPREIGETMVLTEYAALSAVNRQYIGEILMNSSSIVIKTGSPSRTALLSIFGAGTTTRANIAALASRDGSRAEQLFGVDTTVSAYDVARAMGRG